MSDAEKVSLTLAQRFHFDAYGYVLLNNVTVTGNYAMYYGGGFFANTSFSIENSTFFGNTASQGGGLYICSGTIANSTNTTPRCFSALVLTNLITHPSLTLKGHLNTAKHGHRDQAVRRCHSHCCVSHAICVCVCG